MHPKQIAKINNLKKYFSDIPCRKCNSFERYTNSSNCINCALIRLQKRYIENKEDIINKVKANYEKIKADNIKYERFLALKNKAWNKRRAQLIQECPSWADHNKIEEFYIQAKLITNITGEKYEVDHITPLKSKKVCGLHVENNLQILTKAENASKLNKLIEGI